MKLIDRIAYRNAIKLQELHMDLSDYAVTDTYQRMCETIPNRFLAKIFSDCEHAREYFENAKTEFVARRKSGMDYEYLMFMSKKDYVIGQLRSIRWARQLIKDCKNELIEEVIKEGR